MKLERPNLSQISSEVLAYIEALETELELLKGGKKERPERSFENLPPEPPELPTPINMIALTLTGIAKRTPRHFYIRQHRGGMGIFDIEVVDRDQPIWITAADQNQSLLLITNQARVFRTQVSRLNEAEVRSRGESIVDRLPLQPDENIAVVLPDQASGYMALLSQSGMVRCLRHHLFGEYLKPGTSLYNIREFGPLVSACWTTGDADLFIATKGGMAIRFTEKSLPPQGGLAIRLQDQDEAVAITSVNSESGVFLLGADGKGTIRQMSGFNPNKAPGGSGKIAIKTENLITAITVTEQDDLFILTRLCKIIRFKAEEVPATEGVVQGVICISLRGDEVVAASKQIP